MRLRYTLTALRQIDHTLDYIAERSPQGAESVRKRLSAAIMVLEQHPYAGQATSRVGVRRLPLTPHPYLIFYRVAGDEITILRFRHAARRPPAAPGAT